MTPKVCHGKEDARELGDFRRDKKLANPLEESQTFKCRFSNRHIAGHIETAPAATPAHNVLGVVLKALTRSLVFRDHRCWLRFCERFAMELRKYLAVLYIAVDVASW